MHTWKFKKLGTSKLESCGVTLGKSKQGIALKKGEQYWVAASAPETADDVWVWTYNDSMGNFAYEEDGDGWKPDYGNLGGFGVFGVR